MLIELAFIRMRRNSFNINTIIITMLILHAHDLGVQQPIAYMHKNQIRNYKDLKYLPLKYFHVGKLFKILQIIDYLWK